MTTVSSTIPFGEDGFSALFSCLQHHRLGAPCGTSGDVLAFRAVANLWTTPVPSALFRAPKCDLRSLFL